HGFGIDLEALAPLVSPRTRAVLLCSPSNPTGVIYDEATIAGVARIVAERGGPDTYIVTDDIYRRLVYRDTWVSVPRVAPDLADLRAFLKGHDLADDLALAERLFERGVALVPGSGFLAPGFMRISYATSMANVEEGMRRLGRALAELA